MKNKIGIQSVSRAIAILSLFTNHCPHLGITEISHALKLPKATVHGLVRTLLNSGFLQQDPETKKYQIGFKIYELGVILSGNLEINQKAIGPVRQLAKRTRLVCRVAIWDGNSSLLTLNIDPRSHSLFVNQIGPRIPAYCTAIGKSLLAYLPTQELNRYLEQNELIPYTSNTITTKRQLLKELEEVRKKGYSIDHEETVLGLGCIGAPIFGSGGHLVGSISLSGDSDRFLGKEVEQLAKELLKTAQEISRSMGYFSESSLPLSLSKGTKSKSYISDLKRLSVR